MTDDEFTRVDLGLIEGRRDVNGVDAVGTGFGRGSTPTSEYSVADGWAQVRAVEQEDEDVTGIGFNGVVNQPSIVTVDSVTKIQTLSLTAKVLKRSSVKKAAPLLAQNSLSDVNGTPTTTPPQATLFTGLMAKLVQLLYGMPLDVTPLGTLTWAAAYRDDRAQSWGLVKNGDALWLARITWGIAADVSMFQLPFLGVSTALKGVLKRRVKGVDETDPAARLAYLFGDIPYYTGAPGVPGGSTVLSYGAMGTWPSVSALNGRLGWNFNANGTEARAVGLAYYGTAYKTVHAQLQFTFDPVTGAPSAVLSIVEVGPQKTSAPAVYSHHYPQSGYPESAALGVWASTNQYESLSGYSSVASLPASTVTYQPVHAFFDYFDNPLLLKINTADLPLMDVEETYYSDSYPAPDLSAGGRAIVAPPYIVLPARMQLYTPGRTTVYYPPVDGSLALASANYTPSADNLYNAVFLTSLPWVGSAPASSLITSGTYNGYTYTPPWTQTYSGTPSANSGGLDGEDRGTASLTRYIPGTYVKSGSPTIYTGPSGDSGTLTIQRDVRLKYQRRAYIQRGVADRVVILEVRPTELTVSVADNYSLLTNYTPNGTIGSTTSLSGGPNTRVYSAAVTRELGARLIVFGGRETVQIPVTITGLVSSASGTISNDGSTNTLSGLSNMAEVSGVLRGIAFEGDKASAVLQALHDWIVAGNVIERRSTTRPLHRWVKLTALALAYDVGSNTWTVTPTYADGQAPAAKSSALSLSDGNFHFIGDY